MERRSRRAVLGGAAGVAGLLAGCSGLGGDYETVTPAAVPTESGEPSQSFDGEVLTVAHWLSESGEAAGYEALVDRFNGAVPGARVEPSSGTGLSLVERGLEGRVERGDPPSIWQAEAGADLLSLVRQSYLLDVTESVWEQGGLREAYPEDVRRAVRTDGTHVSVPWTGRRVNTLFYNPDVLEAAGVDAERLDGPPALNDALETIAAETETVPLSWPGAVPWQVGQLFEGVLLARTGVEQYREGLTAGFDRSAVETAIETVRTIASSAEESGGWVRTASRLVEGEVGMVVASGRLVGGNASTTGLATREDATYGTDWDVTALPGTAGTVQFSATAFAPPVENPTPELTERWLRFVGASTPQRIYSAAAGSIPLRADVEPAGMTDYTTDQYEAYRSAEVRLPSITNRLVLPPEAHVEYLKALFQFGDGDEAAVTEGLVSALSA